MEPQVAALVNLIIQVLLFAFVGYAGYVARTKKDMEKHCWLMRVAAVVLVLSTVFFMGPSFAERLREGFGTTWYMIEVYAHAALGVAIVAIFIYANLVTARVIKARGRLRGPMQAAAAFWGISLIIGVHMYFVMW